MAIPGDTGRMGSIVGSRRNVHHSGSTAGSCLMECLKSNLKDVPLLATADKHAMLGGARVSDESRISSGKGFVAMSVRFLAKLCVNVSSVGVSSTVFSKSVSNKSLT